FRTIVNDIDATFTATIGGDVLFLRTNWNAPNFKVMAVDLHNPVGQRWRPVIPAGKTVVTSITAAGGRLLASHLEDVQPRLRLYTTLGRRIGEVPLRSIGSVGSVTGDWGQDEAFFSFSSFAQPTTIFRYDLNSGRLEVWSRLSVPMPSANINVQQVWYSSKDGTKIPMFIAHRADLELNGTNPTLLTGYGGFNVSQLPAFSPRAMFWIEHGGIYALPSLRGGGEFGEAWHQAGMLERKQNVFDDFIAAAEWLIDKRYTTPSKLAISGGSNGGLLVGAALTARPELFQAVVCSYPLLDMIRYHRFLVARFWVPEYGSSENEAEFKYLYAYSPYHRVSDGTGYPAVLLISGDSDTRVAPLHARKMTARLQAATRSLGRPILLKYYTKAGHSGGLPVTKTIEDLTDELLFLGWQLGMIRGATTNSIGP
ncbi:MAG: prolyl oligopeptidase family serine peptidase, partial [Acidimicrobiia bacterium]